MFCIIEIGRTPRLSPVFFLFFVKKTGERRSKQKVRGHQAEKRQRNRSGEKGFEPLTSGFGDHCSTIETIPLPHPLKSKSIFGFARGFSPGFMQIRSRLRKKKTPKKGKHRPEYWQ